MSRSKANSYWREIAKTISPEDLKWQDDIPEIKEFQEVQNQLKRSLPG